LIHFYKRHLVTEHAYILKGPHEVMKI